ncbi:MAG: MerC domain-containing protein [Proteobacteria bacterium]|nr:MerC domain-containing protein [Pseudomonadota bacterium]
MDNSSSEKGGILDHAAIALSGLCLVHCLLLPVIIVALPLLGQLNATHFHAQLLIVVIPVSLFAFTLGFRRHANQAIIAGGIAGISLLFIGGTVAHANFGLLADSLLTMAGSIVLATSHYYNNRLTRHVPAS